ncbi:MAG TPA: MBOAT family O-acyltransferase [Bacilli bacterium]
MSHSILSADFGSWFPFAWGTGQSMVFHSPQFLFFFLALLAPYYVFKKGRLAILAIANLIFYGYAGIGPTSIFLLVTMISFITVKLLRKPRLAWVFWVGVAVNLLNLAFFKYTFFFLNTWQAVTGLPLGVRADLAHSIILPAGISFYTFQLISYIIDVRRGTMEPPKTLLHFWVYISLFPQLVAGPILRGNELMPQLYEIERKRVRWQEIKYGMYLAFIGVIKKVVLADTLAQVADRLFAHADTLSPIDAWTAAFAFGYQIYYDFSAYSDMALGLGYILGVKLIINFDSPYISGNPGEFWRRWHISLSRWIKDYIYISLGGNRRGWWRTQFNLFAAMVISGLWHGAMWTFVIWGAVHGLLLIFHKWTLYLNRWRFIAAVRSAMLYRIAAVFVFFHITMWTWVFFRAPSFHSAVAMTRNMLHVDWGAFYASPQMIWIAGLFLLHLFEYVIRHAERISGIVWHLFPAPFRGAVYAALALVVIYFMKGETYAFIYFQF